MPGATGPRAHADLMYQFDVHETTSLGFQPFSFSFTVPTFVTAGQSPAFTPFTVTFGTHSYKMINDLAGTFPGPTIFYTTNEKEAALSARAQPDLRIAPGT